MSIPPPTEKQARILWMSVTGLAIGVLLGLIGLLGWGLGWLIQLLAPIVWPVAISGIMAYLLDPMVDFFVRKKVPRARAILLVFVICVGGVLAVLAQIVPRMVYETQRLIDEVPNYSTNILQRVSGWVADTPVLVEWKESFFPTARDGAEATNAVANAGPTNAGVTNLAAAGSAFGTNQAGGVGASGPASPGSKQVLASRAAQTLVGWLGDVLPEVGNWLLKRLKAVASWAGMIVGLALVPVFVFYLLLEKRSIEGSWTDYLPIQESKVKDELVFVLKAINEYLIVFFRGQVVVAMCIGTLLTIGFLSIGLNYAVLLGVMAGVLSIVPYLGAILTIVPSVILAAVQFKDWLHPLLVVLIFAAVQMLEGLVISPKIMGDRVGLHPMTIIIAVLVGTTLLGGILGGVLAIPLTAALRVLMFRYVWKPRGGEAG